MNKRDLRKVLTRMNRSLGENSYIVAGDLADRVHQTSPLGQRPTQWVYAHLDEVASLFSYQSRCMDGSIDMAGFNECYEWLQGRVQLLDVEIVFQQSTGNRAELLEV